MFTNRKKSRDLHRQQWQEIEQRLRQKPIQEDAAECDSIMACIGELPSQSASQAGLPRTTLRWAGAAVMVVMIVVGLALVIWNDGKGPEQAPHETVEAQDPSVTMPAEGVEHASPLEMFAALQKEQVLVGKDLAKFQLMLNERVILFRQQP